MKSNCEKRNVAAQCLCSMTHGWQSYDPRRCAPLDAVQQHHRCGVGQFVQRSQRTTAKNERKKESVGRTFQVRITRIRR